MTTITKTHREFIHNEVVEDIGELPIEDEMLFQLVSNNVEEHYPLISSEEKSKLTHSVINDVTGYGFLEYLLEDQNVNEIMINSTGCAFVDRCGVLERVELKTSEEELTRLIQKIAASCGARCDTSSPIVDAWLADGSRVHGVLRPVAADGPYITIRRFIFRSFELEQFCKSKEQIQCIKELVSSSKNIVVAGGTSSGKTTLLNCLIHLVNHNERIVSIEETAELNTDHPHWVRLLARVANSEGAGKVSLGDLVKASLRMRPDRIVVGEVRSAEAFDLVQALNTGHDGSLCTIHANGPYEVIHRMASLAMFAHPGLDYEAIVSQICFGIDAIVYVSRNSSGQRCIESISKVKRDGKTSSIVNEESGEINNV